MTDLKIILLHPSVKIVDVRTPLEFSSSSVSRALNIPLSELQLRKSELDSKNNPIVLCCASGGPRSQQADQFLKLMGNQNVYNRGSWMVVNKLVNNA